MIALVPQTEQRHRSANGLAALEPQSQLVSGCFAMAFSFELKHGSCGIAAPSLLLISFDYSSLKINESLKEEAPDLPSSPRDAHHFICLCSRKSKGRRLPQVPSTRLVDDDALAEDLLSEVFLDVWRQAASFEGRSSVSTWLLAILGYRRSTSRSSTSPTTTASRSRRLPKSLASARRP
jgi:hypothetical protein